MVLENGYTLGFLGSGKMGTAVLAAAIAGAEAAKAQNLPDAIVPGRFVVSVRTAKSRVRLQERFGDKVTVVTDNQKVIDESNVVVLGFKPYMAQDILNRLHYSHFTILISLLAGTSIESIRQFTSVNTFIVRATTNTAAQCGQGMTALSYQGEYHPDSPITLAVEWLFNQTGKFVMVEESKQDACVALCGSAPAFTYLFMEALIDGAVKSGLPLETAQTMAAQVVLGAGHMAQVTGRHPASLRGDVCTPGGTTINGLAVLEDRAVRGAVIGALDKATNISQDIGRAANENTASLDQARVASHINLAEMAQQISISRRNTLNAARQPSL